MSRLYILTFLFLVLTIHVNAATEQSAISDVLDSNGKIYVVVLVLATIFAGIILYLVRLDRKISKFEKNK